MKKLKIVLSVMVLVGTLFTGMTAVAANNAGLPDKLPMLASRPEMISYQVNSSHRAFMQVYGNRLIPGGRPYTWLYNSNPDKLAQSVTSYKLDYHVTELGPIGLSVEWQNDDGYTTFIGYTNTETIMTDSGKVVLKVTSLEPEMVSEPYIKLQSEDGTFIYSLLMKIFDQQGNLVEQKQLYSYSSRNENGGVMVQMPVAYLGDALARNGYTAEFCVGVYNPNTGESATVAYNPTSGEVIPGYDGEATIGSVNLKGTVRLTDSDVFAKVVTTNAVGENPLYILTLTATKSVTVYAKTSEGKVAKGCKIKLIDETGKTIAEQYVPNGSNLSGLGAGLYHIWFDWNDGDLIDADDYYWYYHSYYGEKG